MSDPAPLDPELAALRRSVEEMERSLASAGQTEQRLRAAEQQLKSLTEMTGEVVAITERGVVIEVNQRFSELFGYDVEEIIGKSALTVHPPEVHEEVLSHIRVGDERPYEAPCQRKDGSIFLAEIQGRALLHQGRPARVTVIRDITDRKRAEEADRAAAVQQEVLRAQEALLSALSTPLLPITKEVLVLPLIGAVNAERADQVINTLVYGVAQHRVKTAILDITGVPDVDTRVADALLRAARAARLLGARVALTGIRAEVAQRFVLLGMDLGELVTYGTLQQGVTAELARRR